MLGCLAATKRLPFGKHLANRRYTRGANHYAKSHLRRTSQSGRDGRVLLRREIAPRLALGYVLAQGAGSIIGVLVAHLMFDLPSPSTLGESPQRPAQWFAEVVATFGLVLTILATLKAKPAAVPMSVGLYIIAAYWFTASTSFANPAVTLARTFSDTFAGIRLGDAALFVVAELFGAFCALPVSRALYRKTRKAHRFQPGRGK